MINSGVVCDRSTRDRTVHMEVVAWAADAVCPDHAPQPRLADATRGPHAGGRHELEESDADLVAACRRGDAVAWDRLLQRYQRLIYTIPLRCGLSTDEAADVFQQTCLRLFERLETLHDPSRLQAWLVTTSRRLSLDAIARRRGEQPLNTATIQEPADKELLPEESLIVLEEQHRIRGAVMCLDPRCRALLYHLFYDPDEPSYATIATSMRMPNGSIGPVRARCFARLKVLLDD